MDGMKFIITKANSDSDGRVINKIIDEYEKDNKDKIIAFTSMGYLRYLSAMKYCNSVIGNSSSGIIEAPSFNKPTINIGDRQKGRMQAESVINCKPNSSSITLAIKKSLSPEFKNTLPSIVNPYGGEDTCNKIINIITKFLNSTIDLKKTFYNINF